MTESFAALPMYDWPEVRGETDRLWRGIAANLNERGIPAPETRQLPDDLLSSWRIPGLVVSQTCGFPYVTQLRGEVRIVGAPHFDLDCKPGFYFSELIVPRSSALRDLRGFHGRVAVNGVDSQSGYAALLHSLWSSNDECIPAFSIVISGSHRQSVAMVARGEADLAAIDAVSFGFARRHMPEAERVRFIGRTEPTPGLPYITGRPEADIAIIRDAMADAIAALSPADRQALQLEGIVAMSDADYDVIADRWAALQPALAAMTPPLTLDPANSMSQPNAKHDATMLPEGSENR